VAVTAADLLARVGGAASDNTLAQACVGQGVLYVAKYRESMDPDPLVPVTLPEAIEDSAVLACAEDIWVRTKAENGIVLTSYQPGDNGPGVVVRIGRDPLVPVRALLDPWYPPLGFA